MRMPISATTPSVAMNHMMNVVAAMYAGSGIRTRRVTALEPDDVLDDVGGDAPRAEN